MTVSGSTVTLSWTPPSGGCAPTTYGIEAGSSPGASNLANILTGNSSTSFTASSVPGGTYYVRVRAGNGNAIGGVSNEVTVIVSGSGGGTLTILLSQRGERASEKGPYVESRKGSPLMPAIILFSFQKRGFGRRISCRWRSRR